MNCSIPGCQVVHGCRTPGCNRERLTSSGGTKSPWCDTCVRFYLTQAFGENPPQTWVERANAGMLPGRIEGGIKA